MIVYAAEEAHKVAAKAALARIENAILFPLMTLMMAVALFVFIWGAYEYVAHAGSSEAQDKGKQHMLYGIIGLVVMVSAYGILKIAAGTFGISVP
jgi:TRAP-type C4-dicarboxylate transport system permease small subunit